MADGAYDVVIDSTLASGHLTYGELVLPGEIEDEKTELALRRLGAL